MFYEPKGQRSWARPLVGILTFLITSILALCLLVTAEHLYLKCIISGYFFSPITTGSPFLENHLPLNTTSTCEDQPSQTAITELRGSGGAHPTVGEEESFSTLLGSSDWSNNEINMKQIQ